MQPSTTNRGFSFRAFSEGLKRKFSPKGKQENPKGILRQSSNESNCSFCTSQNSRTHNSDSLKNRLGALPGCQTCITTKSDSLTKKRVSFDAVVRERNYIKSDEEQQSSTRKYRKLSKSFQSAKTVKPCFQSALFACSICNITMATESEFITHQRQHGFSGGHVMQYPLPYQFHGYKSASPLLFVRQ